jgi:hypothetical protein
MAIYWEEGGTIIGNVNNNAEVHMMAFQHLKQP